MNTPSVIVLLIILALCGLALWRVHKKGAPCECGVDRKCCGGGGCCCRDEKA